MCVHRSGAFLERNRLALRVPVNLTKFEIREYLRKLYDAKVIKVNTLIKVPRIKRDFSSRKPRYYRNGPMYKKAIVTLEHAVPDEVKMLGSDFELGRNPAITGRNFNYGKKGPARRPHLPLPVRNAHALPLTNLLADEDWELALDAPGHRMAPDPTEPHVHDSEDTQKPASVPPQQFSMLDITPWRRRLGGALPATAEPKPTPWRFPKPT